MDPTQKGRSTAHVRTLVPNTIPGIVFGTRVIKWAVCSCIYIYTYTSGSFETGHAMNIVAVWESCFFDVLFELPRLGEFLG